MATKAKTKTMARKRPGSAVTKAPVRKSTPPAQPKAASASAGRDATALTLIRDELAALRAALEQMTAPRPGGAGATDEVDAIRRLFSDLMEQKLESVVRDLVAMRIDAAADRSALGVRMAEQIDDLVGKLGAVRFEAQRLDHVDVLIHTVAREAHMADVPAGVVVETIRPGFRTGRGLVVAKALVVVNRRS